jgi:hypothetical protein
MFETDPNALRLGEVFIVTAMVLLGIVFIADFLKGSTNWKK